MRINKSSGANMIIALEGIEGCGKTTQSLLLSDELEAKTLKFPNYNRVPLLRKYMHNSLELDGRSSFLLFLADIIEGTKDIKGKVIIDRYFYSTVAYAKFEFEKAKEIPKILGLKKADLVVLLDIEPELGIKRKTESNMPLDRYEKDIEFLKKVRERYLKLAEEQYMGKWVVVNANKKPIEIFKEILKALEKEQGL